MYEPPAPEEQRPGCRETWALTRATFGIILPALLVMFAVLGVVAAAIALFPVHPALALLPLAALAGGIALFIRWERSRFPPPDA